MAGDLDAQLYRPIEQKLGFYPATQLREGHPTPASNQTPPSLQDFFRLTCWSRTGKPLPIIGPQRNDQGLEVFPGANINFEFVSVNTNHHDA